MANARDHAADLLLGYDRKGTWIATGIEAARAELSDPRERSLLTELALGCVRTQGTLDAVLASASKRPIPRLDAVLRIALRLGLYQVIYLDRIPDHAAVDHAVGWARRRAGADRAGFVNGVLRSLLRSLSGPATGAEDLRRDVPREDDSALRFEQVLFPDPVRDRAGNLASRYSMPGWLVVRWLKQWGEERCTAVLHAGITRPPLSLRARAGVDALDEVLQERGLEFEVLEESSARLLRDGEGAVVDLIEGGRAAVQDATSQRVAPLLEPRRGQSVLDLCASPGGKALHLADLMGAGLLVATDVSAEKLERLAALAPAMGDVEYRVRAVDAKAPLALDASSFDAILVDAPCTNTGVLRRRVEARWRLRPEDIDSLAAVQLDLLERSLPLLRSGGRLVYSTCSLEPEENKGVVAALVAAHPELTQEPGFQVWPTREADGGSAVVLRKG